MKVPRPPRRTSSHLVRWTAPVLVALALAAWASRAPNALTPISAATPGPSLSSTAVPQKAAVVPRCTLEAVEAAALPGMTIGQIDDLNPALPPAPTGVRLIPASGDIPAHCLITGSVVTNPRSGETANFGFALPLVWNQRFVFSGCGRYCGQVFQGLPSDPKNGLATGNAVAATDDGHASTPPGEPEDVSWALLKPGVPNEDAVDDYLYRAVHTVTTVGQQFVQRWYAGALARSYFIGCSDGGREGMVEATRYPEDFDGWVVGDPFFDMPGQTLAGRAAVALLDAPDAYIPPDLMAIVNSAVYASCDAADGVKDNLIQNPGKCSFDPATLLCTPSNMGSCLTPHQVDTLERWFSAARDPLGRVVSYGYPVSDIYDKSAPGANLFVWAEGSGPPLDINAPEPWGGSITQQPAAWSGYDQAFKYLVFRDPTFDDNHHSPVDRFGIVNPIALALLDERTAAGRGDDPLKLFRFLQLNRKVLMYHGYSDGFINPFRTITFFEEWARLVGGYNALGQHARLFMVPGMNHCAGGPGPNTFDVTTAIENWVEHGVAPEQLLATKRAGDDPMMPVGRTMPLCRFPTQATYAGFGDVNDAANWSCKANEELLTVGPNGVSAGLPR